MRVRPHVLDPTPESARAIIVYRGYADQPQVCHAGLGIAAINNCKSLRAAGIDAAVWPCTDADGLRKQLASACSDAILEYGHPPTHVVISAPWIATAKLADLARAFPNIVFSVCCHSNVGFLQVDPAGIRLLRESFDLARSVHNFVPSGNSQPYADWVAESFSVRCQLLPNMYFLEGMAESPLPRVWRGGTLRVGCFSALRPLKNHQTAAAAALALRDQLNCELEFWINSGRIDGAPNTVQSAVSAMLADVPGVALKEAVWKSWPAFRTLVRSMHLLFQLSYTESFNMVTADGVAEGVPAVVSQAIAWAPASWRVNSDDALDAAQAARRVLIDPLSARDGWKALQAHNQSGLAAWKEFLLI